MSSMGNNLEPGSELDAPGEEDVDFTPYNGISAKNAATAVVSAAEDDGSDADAEGEEVDEGDFEDNNAASAISFQKGRSPKLEDEEEADADAETDEDAMVDALSDAKSVKEDDESVTSEFTEAEWEEESDNEESIEASVADRSCCVFCGEDEEHDPGEEFEEYLACAVCGDNAHRQCARDADCFDDDIDGSSWKCQSCTENGLQENGANNQRSSSPAKLIKPIDRRKTTDDHTEIKDDSHSAPGSLISSHDFVAGPRSLRKRKAPEEDAHSGRRMRKRRRASDSPALSTESSPASRRLGAESIDHIQFDGAVSMSGSPKPRLSRTRRQPQQRSERALVEVLPNGGGVLVLSFNLDPERMQKILSARPRPKKLVPRERDRSKKKIQPPMMQEAEPPHYPPLPSTYNSAVLYGLNDREQDDPKAKPYGGILTEAEADNSRTFPQIEDRKRFEEARLKAEDDWRQKVAVMNTQPEPTKPSQKLSGPPSKIKCINFGGYEIDTWHAAPYPEEYSRNKVLYICEFCLKYMNSDYVAWRHKLKCPAKHPPGDEIYRDGKYSFFEVDGRKNTVYCQNLCLLAKLFLGSKTLYYDVDPFLFYVMTENDDMGCHFVGYFSKEKRPSSMNNVSCILVLPIYQRRGFGHYLIDFSYLLTREENKTGSPEKPLSDMGLVSYRGYWRLVLCYQLLDQKTPIGLPDLSERTGMTADDIVSALEGLRALVRDPVTKSYALRLDRTYYKEYIAKYEAKGYPKINPRALIWVPYVMGRNMERHFEDGPTLHTVAQREEETHDDEPDPLELFNGTGKDMPMGLADGNEGASQNNGTKDGNLDGVKGHVNMSTGKENDINGSTPRNSPNKTRSRPRTPQGAGAMPSTNGVLEGGAATPIPPNRFEVFPPIPGMSTVRRRPGRPFGSRTRNRSGAAITPIKRSTSNAQLGNGIGVATPDTASRNTYGRRPNSANGRPGTAGSSAGSSRVTRRNPVREIGFEQHEHDENPREEELDEEEADVDADADGDMDMDDANGVEDEDEDEGSNADAEGEDEE